MRKVLYQARISGTITIYLTLILLVILSLIFTIIEGARVSTAKGIAERALSTSMDSVLAEYYGPLWEEYHIFGYNAGEGSSDDRSVGIEEKLTEYMSCTLKPGMNMEGYNKLNAIELYDTALVDIAADNQTKLMDYDGELFINEAVEYMKYDEMVDGIELLLDKMSLLETPKKVSAVYDEKLAAEQELVEIDKSVLKLMELFDGIKTSNKGIELDQEGRLQSKQYFIKMLCNSPITQETVGINHDAVFLAVKDHYINPIDSINRIKSILGSLEQGGQELNRLSEAQRGISEELIRAQEKLRQLDSGSKKSKKLQQQIKDAIAQIESIIAAGRGISLAIEEQNEIIECFKADVQTVLREFLNSINELIPLVEEAISTIDDIMGIASRAKEVITKFENTLDIEQEGLDLDVFTELEEALAKMKSYTAPCEEENGYAAMRESLVYDLRILHNTEEYLMGGQAYLAKENYQEADRLLTACSNELKNYEISSLKLDYSSLILDQSKQRNPISKLNNQLQQGLTSLVIDPQDISKKKVSSTSLPSIEEAMLDDTQNFTELLEEFMKKCSTGGENFAAMDFFHGYSDTSDIAAVFGEGINIITEQLLFREYLRKNFERYQTKQEGEIAKKPSALDYEQEYLLVGKTTDQENLASVIARIVFLRTIIDFVSILRDKVKCGEALAAATALVGFTGFPILISITKTILLIVWAFAEALVDTCALMMGKEVPIIKKKIVITFPELFLLNRTFLQSKTSALETAKISFSYQDYLRLFLLFKNKKDLAYRSMDLIQENINLRYEEKFHMSNCLYGFQAEARFSIGTKFLAIPFIRKSITDLSEFGFMAKWENSY